MDATVTYLSFALKATAHVSTPGSRLVPQLHTLISKDYL